MAKLSWIQALQVYNKGKTWSVPRKGTLEHKAVKDLMNGNSSGSGHCNPCGEGHGSTPSTPQKRGRGRPKKASHKGGNIFEDIVYGLNPGLDVARRQLGGQVKDVVQVGDGVKEVGKKDFNKALALAQTNPQKFAEVVAQTQMKGKGFNASMQGGFLPAFIIPFIPAITSALSTAAGAFATGAVGAAGAAAADAILN